MILNIITLIAITIIGIILTIQDYIDREVDSIYCYTHLFLITIFLFNKTAYWPLFLVLAMLCVIIVGFDLANGDSNKINFIDFIYLIEVAGVIMILKDVEDSKLMLLPLLIIWFIYILIEKLIKQKFEDKIPFLSVCCPLISVYLIWYSFV